MAEETTGPEKAAIVAGAEACGQPHGPRVAGIGIAPGAVQWESAPNAARHALRRADEALRGQSAEEVALERDEAVRAFHFALVSACDRHGG